MYTHISLYIVSHPSVATISDTEWAPLRSLLARAKVRVALSVEAAAVVTVVAAAAVVVIVDIAHAYMYVYISVCVCVCVCVVFSSTLSRTRASLLSPKQSGRRFGPFWQERR